MSHRISATVAAAAVIGLGGLLAAATPVAVSPAAADTVTSRPFDVSAQRRGGGGGGGAARRAAPRPAARAARPAARAARPAARAARPAARPAARAVARPGVAARRGVVVRGGRRVTVVRRVGPYRWPWRWRGRYWPLVAIGTLGVLTVGAVAYSAYGYVPLQEPVCSGEGDTPGCILRWTNVPSAEDPGVLVPACVQYCPR
jgi:hypothetical protein